MGGGRKARRRLTRKTGKRLDCESNRRQVSGLKLEHVPASGMNLQLARHATGLRVLRQSDGVRQQNLTLPHLDEHGGQITQVLLQRCAGRRMGGRGIPAQALFQPILAHHGIRAGLLVNRRATQARIGDR